MASIILAAAGSAIGGSIGGAVLGVSAATIGGAIGSLAGAAIDSWLVASMAPTQRIAGQRLDTLQITASTEGAVIPRVYGCMRLGGNIIWATDFREETRTTEQGGGKGGGGGGTEVTEYFYFASLAVALCEGPITGIGRVWADGKLMSLEGVTMRLHLGGENQDPDPFISAKMGAPSTPAYRGTAYVVFEELPLERFGNRLPQLSFEVFRPILDGASAESLVRAVTLIPASGEFAYATEVVRREVGETTSPENVNAEAHAADIVVALDRLEACPTPAPTSCCRTCSRSQAQKHVTHNEALRLLDGLVQVAVLDRDLTAPPGSPADGGRYIVASGATGAWTGWDGSVAYWVDGAWMRLVPRPGWRAWVETRRRLWSGPAGPGSASMPRSI